METKIICSDWAHKRHIIFL